MIGIESHCFRLSKRSPATILSYARRNGFRQVAYYTEDIAQLCPEDLDKLARLASTAGVTLTATVPSLHENQDDEVYKKHFRLSSALGASFVRIYVQELATRDFAGSFPVDHICRRLKTIVGMASDFGATVALENHGDLRVIEIQQLLAAIPRLRVCFDVGNQVAVPEDPEASFEQLQASIVIVHLKDVAWKIENNDVVAWRAVPLGKGGLPLATFVERALAVVPPHLVTFEMSSSGGLRRVRLPSNSEMSFFRRHQRYESAFDHYYMRGNATQEELTRQEIDHLEESRRWLVQRNLLPEHSNEEIDT